MKSSRNRGLSALAVVGLCLGAYVVFAMAFHWLVAPTVAKGRAEIAELPAAATAPLPSAIPAAPKAAAPRAAALPPSGAAPTASPTAQLDLPSRFVAQPRPSPVPEARPLAKPRSATAAATDTADPKPLAKKPVARTAVRQERPAQRNSWGDFAWSNNSGHSSRPWF